MIGKMKDPKVVSGWISKNSPHLAAWGLFATTLLFVAHFLSDRDFSFLMTVASLISMFAFLMVFVNIAAVRSAAGVSVKMVELYTIVIIARLCSILPFEGYLPYDRTGDWLYQTVEVLCLVLALGILFISKRTFSNTYDPANDSFPILYLIIPTLALAILFHPSLNNFMPCDIAWTFAIYLESFACLPQLFLFQKEGTVQPFTGHFLAGQTLSKFLGFLFWVSSYTELNMSAKGIKRFVGIWVILMQVMQLVVMADFLWHYLRCLAKGRPIKFLLSPEV